MIDLIQWFVILLLSLAVIGNGRSINLLVETIEMQSERITMLRRDVDSGNR